MVTNDDNADRLLVRKRLVYLMTAGLLVRLVLWYLVGGASPQIVDAQDYDGLAARLVEQGAYVSKDGHRVSLRPPLYPAFVAAIYRVVGSHNYAAIYAAQSLINLATVWLVFRLGVATFDRHIGLCAATVYCFYPTFLAHEQLLLTEVLATFLLTSATLCLVLSRARRNWGLLASAGVLFGLAALTRSATLLLIPFVASWLICTWPESLGRRFVAGMLVVAVFASVIGPWSYRNTRLHGTLTIIDVMGGRNAMMGNYEHTPLERSWATIEITDDEKAWNRVLRRAQPHDYRPGITQSEIDKLAMRYALRFMCEHPALTIQRSSIKFFNFWQLEREVVAGAAKGSLGNSGRAFFFSLAVVICGYYALCLFGAVFGAVLRPPPDRALHSLLLLCIAVPCAAHSLIFAHSRYHLPLVPLLAIYAASAFIGRRDFFPQVRSPRFVTASAICLLLLCGWIRELIMVDLHHLL